MGEANRVQSSFDGGEWSKAMQGRIDKPEYRTAMNICLNGLPIESGAWTRRPGTQHAWTTRSGLPGRVIPFEFKEARPYTMEFTDSHLRFRNGPNLATTNDGQTVLSADSNSPMNVAVASSWPTGSQVFFPNTTVPLLMNRTFTWTNVSGTVGSLTDAIDGTAINGALVGAVPAGISVKRVLDITTPFISVGWSQLHSIQAEKYSVMVNGITVPQVLTATVSDAVGQDATFALTPANFIDGPYNDPISNGALLTPSGLSGNVSMALSFPAYVAGTSYPKDAIVTSAGVNYQSLVDQNLGNTPASSPTKWTPVSAGIAVGPNGFQGSDIGRHIRLLSEPPEWATGTTYAAKDVVRYNDQYWSSIVGSNAGNQPGIDVSKWGINATGAVWTWGKITNLLNAIDQATGTAIGDLTSGGGITSPYDGLATQLVAQSAYRTAAGAFGTERAYSGKNYTGAAKAVALATVNLPTDINSIIYQSQVVTSGGNSYVGPTIVSFTFNLRGKATAPSSASDGALLGTSGALLNPNGQISVISTDQTTTFNYIWVEVVAFVTHFDTGIVNAYLTIGLAEVTFFSPTGAGTSSGIVVQILGSNLLYTSPIRTWRLGLYNNLTGWPTCGCYHEGRIWLSGSVGNRIDGARPAQVLNSAISFAPTERDGTVSDSNAISYTFDAEDVNAIYWMKSDQPGIICGTQGGEWLVQATALNQPLTPTSIQAHRVTKIGCAAIKPVHTDHTTVFIQKFKRAIIEFFSDVFSGKLTAPNLTEQAKHLAVRGIAELAYQQELVPIIWARCDDGSLIGTTYKRDSLMSSQGPKLNGWHRHVLGSGRTVESICTGSSADGLLDALTMVTVDPVTLIRHVELMRPVFDETQSNLDAWFLDDALIRPVTQNVILGGVSTMTVAGLWHLAGKTVSVFANGLDLGDYTVTVSGTLSVPYGRDPAGLFTASFAANVTEALIGFTFTSDGQCVRPDTQQDAGTRSGPGFGHIRRSHDLMALLVNTQGISFGTTFGKLNPANFKLADGTPIPVTTLFSDIHWDKLQDDYSRNGSMICWRISRPYPATVAAIGAATQTQG